MDPNKIYQKIHDSGQEWVRLQAKSDLIHECQKSELATLVLKYLPECKSMAEAETRARASDDWREFLKMMVAAKEMANEARVKYHAAQSWFEAMRSVESTKRAEMRL